jgi:Uma2 family endonuclease
MAASPALSVQPRPITVDEYYRMDEAGIFRPDERVELLNGRILEMPPIGPRHGYVVAVLYAKLHTVLGDRVAIFCQSGFRLNPLSEPQPDIAIVRGPIDNYANTPPTPAGALLLIEVSESTLPHDSGEKLHAYARADVPEYWIVDLVHERIEVYTEPEADRYRAHRSVLCGETVAPRAFPDVVIAVNEVLPKQPET